MIMNHAEIIDTLNQMKWLKLTQSLYPNERRYEVIGTSYSFYINPASIVWVVDFGTYDLRIISFDTVLENVSQKIRNELLFNLEIFKYSIDGAFFEER